MNNNETRFCDVGLHIMPTHFFPRCSESCGSQNIVFVERAETGQCSHSVGAFSSNRSLSSSFTATLVHAVNANCVNHCSSFYSGLPGVQLQPLDGVLRAAARMIGGVPKFGHNYQ